jgi:hypothetical protein
LDQDTYDVLKEHIAFLREQLAARQLWHDFVFEGLRAELAKLDNAFESARAENVKLKVALAQAVQEVYFHDEQDGNPHDTDDGDYDRWNALLGC